MYGTSDVVWLWKGLDLSAFPKAQMLYPAAGVMMAYLITKKGDKNLPTVFYIFFVALTAVLVVCTAASVLAPQNRDLMSMPYSQWAPIMNYVIIGGSVISGFFFCNPVKKSADPMD